MCVRACVRAPYCARRRRQADLSGRASPSSPARQRRRSLSTAAAAEAARPPLFRLVAPYCSLLRRIAPCCILLRLVVPCCNFGCVLLLRLIAPVAPSAGRPLRPRVAVVAGAAAAQLSAHYRRRRGRSAPLLRLVAPCRCALLHRVAVAAGAAAAPLAVHRRGRSHPPRYCGLMRRVAAYCALMRSNRTDYRRRGISIPPLRLVAPCCALSRLVVP